MLKTIAVHVDQDTHCARRVRAAAQLAVAHQAYLTGIHASFVSPRHFHDGVILPADIEAVLRGRSVDERNEAERQFRAITDEIGATAFWRSPPGAAEHVLPLQTRYADLLVLSQPDLDHRSPSKIRDLLASVMLDSGKPTLMVPSVGPIRPVGQRVLLCWNGEREAARALDDAAPLIRQAESLVILCVDAPAYADRHPGWRDDLLTYCKRHAYPVSQLEIRERGHVGVGNTILNAAADFGADLIVMGAYGHSRLRQAVFGGATRTMLDSMTVPVLFSH